MIKKKEKSEKELLSDINKKLDKLIGILAIQNIKNIKDKIYLLKNLDFKSNEVAPLVGIKADAIRRREGWKRK